jgi:hypothetical protein
MEHLPWKYRVSLAAGITLTGWSVGAYFLAKQIKEMKETNARELEVIDRARKIIMLKAAKGEYDTPNSFDGARFLSDYEFYKIAARESILKGE